MTWSGGETVHISRVPLGSCGIGWRYDRKKCCLEGADNKPTRSLKGRSVTLGGWRQPQGRVEKRMVLQRAPPLKCPEALPSTESCMRQMSEVSVGSDTCRISGNETSRWPSSLWVTLDQRTTPPSASELGHVRLSFRLNGEVRSRSVSYISNHACRNMELPLTA